MRKQYVVQPPCALIDSADMPETPLLPGQRVHYGCEDAVEQLDIAYEVFAFFLRAEAAAKAAEQASALDKVKLEIEAERAKAAWAKAEQKRKMAEVANRERAAAKAAKKEAQAARERKKKLFLSRAA